MPKPLLDIRNLTFEVDRHAILDRLDLAIESQEIHAFLGANGSGKTTLAYVLMGCESYTPGALAPLQTQWGCSVVSRRSGLPH